MVKEKDFFKCGEYCEFFYRERRAGKGNNHKTIKLLPVPCDRDLCAVVIEEILRQIPFSYDHIELGVNHEYEKKAEEIKETKEIKKISLACVDYSILWDEWYMIFKDNKKNVLGVYFSDGDLIII